VAKTKELKKAPFIGQHKKKAKDNHVSVGKELFLSSALKMFDE
jgi:hypothetical protein